MEILNLLSFQKFFMGLSTSMKQIKITFSVATYSGIMCFLESHTFGMWQSVYYKPGHPGFSGFPGFP